MNNLCLKLPNVDRVGLVNDISRVLAERKINIHSMEVEPNTVFLEIHPLPASEKQAVFTLLQQIPQITAVIEIPLMPYQEKSEQLKAVLSSVSDGIVAVDQYGTIIQYNPAAEKIIAIAACQALGQHIRTIFPPDVPLLQILQSGGSYDNYEVVGPQPHAHYLTSGRPIKDYAGRTIGAVAILKDIGAVRELVYTFTGQMSLSFGDIIYTSEVMKRAATLAKTIAHSSSTVLIRGETGTGKELFARAIHDASPRASAVFVPINCAAIPDTLLESELFGYKDGAFTGAAKNGKPGLFEIANGGTLFLDEIGELSAQLQAKLLRVLQEGKVRRIGDTQETAVDVRILAATNRNLEAMMGQGAFREDLYYRINVIPLFIPPLKARREDIPLLSDFFLRRYAARLRKPLTAISQPSLAKLMDYHWPGNIRELENVIERAVNLASGTILLNEHIILDQGYQPTAIPCPPTIDRPLADSIAETERAILQQALGRCRSLRQLGEMLGLSHTAIAKKLRKYGLTLPK